MHSITNQSLSIWIQLLVQSEDTECFPRSVNFTDCTNRKKRGGEGREGEMEGGKEGRWERGRKEGRTKKKEKYLQAQLFSVQNTSMVISKTKILESTSGFACFCFQFR